MSILGLDIGGANIKAANDSGRAVSRPFAIWKSPEQLGQQIESLRAEFPASSTIAVTMTAELADCFETKTHGVQFILDQVAKASNGTTIVVWTTRGRFVSIAQACQEPTSVAAANWHALATWIGGDVAPHGTSLLIDIGTTTTDIIPLMKAQPASRGLTDTQRLQTGELCYSGVKRTPLCAIAHSVPFREGYCPLAAELFATTLDIYLLLGDFPENASDLETANGKPATVPAAHDRIARSLCADRDEISLDEARQISKFIADVQRQRLAGALERVTQGFAAPCETVVVSGSGSFLAHRLVRDNRRLASSKIESLDQILSPQVAESACAYAVAQLATKR